MGNKKILKVFCLIVLWLGHQQAQAGDALELPTLKYSKGDVELQGRGREWEKAKDNVKLWDLFQLRSKANSEGKIAFGPNLSLRFRPDSVVQVLTEVPNQFDVKLMTGAIRLRCANDCPKVVISTDVAALQVSEGDFVLSYDSSVARAKLEVISGSLKFGGLENFESHQLESGEMADFTALVENGAVAYDELLRGKKAVRGQLSAKTKIAVERLSFFEAEALKDQQRQAPKVVKVKRLPGQICEKPFAKLNECVWFFDKKIKKCVRQRCDANGKWSDSFVTDPAGRACSRTPVVKTCDY